jgi:hypothetical protein
MGETKFLGEPTHFWFANLSTVHRTLRMRLFLVKLLSLGTLLLVVCMALEGSILTIQPISMGVILLHACMVLDLAMFWEALLSLVLNNLGGISLLKIFTPLENITWGDFQILLVPTMLHYLPKIHFQYALSFLGDIGLTWFIAVDKQAHSSPLRMVGCSYQVTLWHS